MLVELEAVSVSVSVPVSVAVSAQVLLVERVLELMSVLLFVWSSVFAVRVSVYESAALVSVAAAALWVLR